ELLATGVDVVRALRELAGFGAVWSLRRAARAGGGLPTGRHLRSPGSGQRLLLALRGSPRGAARRGAALAGVARRRLRDCVRCRADRAGFPGARGQRRLRGGM
ncbi:MAG: hypothetical protein AVDCRST_MAG78-1133, partial [uncultured Rubrobacteraceae bacterium]